MSNFKHFLDQRITDRPCGFDSSASGVTDTLNNDRIYQMNRAFVIKWLEQMWLPHKATKPGWSGNKSWRCWAEWILMLSWLSWESRKLINLLLITLLCSQFYRYHNFQTENNFYLLGTIFSVWSVLRIFNTWKWALVSYCVSVCEIVYVLKIRWQ